MSIGKRFRALNITAFVLAIGLAVTITMALLNQQALNRAQEIRYESYLRANELRLSSEDLTRLARTYVVTGEEKYEKMYWEVLDVRNGKKARPDGRTISLRELMEQLGFTTEEFAKLKESETNSNALVTTETIAMNAVKGRFADDTGAYAKTGTPDPEMARRIMHDTKYHGDKEIIMKPIAEFEHLLNSRTQKSVDRFVLLGNVLLGIIAVLAIFTALSIFFVSSSVNGVLRGIVAKLKEVTSQATGSTGALVESATTLSASSTEQAASIQETVATLDEIKAMVNKSLESARASAELARNNNEAAEKGREAAGEMQKSVSEIESSNAEMIRHIQDGNVQLSEIVKIISEIDSKTKVINDIVFQTKLLSFNASVEAARAGEHGKGFAVVAEEVGNLASMSGNAAKEITSMLESSNQKVDQIIRTMSERIQSLSEASRQKMERGTQTADRCGQSFKAVADSVASMNEMMEAITRASDEQAHGVSEISKAMQQLSETTNTNTTVSHQTASYADSLKGNTDVLQALVDSIETEILGSTQRAPAGSESNVNHLPVKSAGGAGARAA